MISNSICFQFYMRDFLCTLKQFVMLKKKMKHIHTMFEKKNYSICIAKLRVIFLSAFFDKYLFLSTAIAK